MKHFFLFCFFLFNVTFALADLFDPEVLQSQLTGDGLVGQVHGANDDLSLYVLTIRDPANFFVHREYPLVWDNPTIADEFKTLKRHQTVRIFGDIIDNHAPVQHILVTHFLIEKNYSSEDDQYNYIPKTKIEELLQQTNFIGRVHAIGEDGKMLVMEYKDLVTPVFVADADSASLTQNLFRGDKLFVNYKVRNFPGSPKHLQLLPSTPAQPSVTVLESVRQFHLQHVLRTGYLVKFPQSPQISSDTYAVLSEDAEGSSLQWTVLNLEDMGLFQKIREKMASLWNSDTSNIVNGRNKLINTKVIVTVSGTGNVVDAGQANPQILVNSLDDIQLSK